MKKSVVLGAVTVALMTASTLQSNLISNGDFESGNTGFTTGYTYSPGDVRFVQTYTVDTDPKNNDPDLDVASYADHTSGSGNMLILNGSEIDDITVWQQQVSMTPNTDYSFSYWLSSWVAVSPAQLDCSIGSDYLGTHIAPNITGQWVQASYPFNSGTASAVTIRLVDRNLQRSGNDFAIDDISFTSGQAVIPAPGALLLGGIGVGFVGWLRRRKAV